MNQPTINKIVDNLECIVFAVGPDADVNDGRVDRLAVHDLAIEARKLIRGQKPPTPIVRSFADCDNIGNNQIYVQDNIGFDEFIRPGEFRFTVFRGDHGPALAGFHNLEEALYYASYCQEK